MRNAPAREMVEEASDFLIRRAIKKGAASADVLYSFGCGNSLSLRDGFPEKNTSGTSLGVGLRTVDREGRQGIAHVNSLDAPHLEEIVEWSLTNCTFAEPDPFIRLSEEPLEEMPSLELEERRITELTHDERMAACTEMWETARDADPRAISVRSASWGDGWGETHYRSSTGISGWYSGASAGCAASVILQEGEIMEMGGAGDDSRSISALSPSEVSLQAVKRAALVIGGSPLPTGRYDLVIDGESAASLVDVIGELFLASNIHKNRSFLKGMLGKQVSSPALTLVDDGILKKGLASAPFDGEGVRCGTTRILSDGVAVSWLYNMKYALMDGVPSTGNASRSISGTPDVGCSNLSLRPGRWSREDLFIQAENGIYVTELLGLHTINPVSGEFSIGIKGARISGGATGGAVSGMTIAGNMKDFMMNIDLIGNDFKYYGSTGACSLVVRDVAAAGS
ncbi:MAG: TldD/PmbA family protein [Synergistaceae bacterium]|nr:TldD/PmbA family protein [Synergistaceae bacterium]MDD4612419.1 TldD/PmbA family protein [Synergistaceae bacterium]